MVDETGSSVESQAWAVADRASCTRFRPWYAVAPRPKHSTHDRHVRSAHVKETHAPVTLGSPVFRTVAARSVSVVSAWFPPNTNLGMHSHAGALFGMMLEGGFATRIMGRDAHYRAGSAWTEPAEERHANLAGAAGARVLVLQPALNVADLEPIARGLLDEVVTIEAADLMADAVRLESECARPDDLSPLVVEGTALSLLARAARLFRAGVYHARMPRWLSMAVEYLHAHRLDTVQLGDVARTVGVGPSQLAHGFRERLGTTPGEYLRRLRIEWAADQLRDGGSTVAEIALRAGFYDQSHFTRVFRRQYGVTPAAWREGAYRCSATFLKPCQRSTSPTNSDR